MMNARFAVAPFALLAALGVFFAPMAHAQEGYGGNQAGVNVEMRLASVEDQIRALTGKTEQVDYALRRMDQVLQRLQGDLENRLSKLEAQQASMQTAVQAGLTPHVAATSAAPETARAEEAEEVAPVNGTLGGIKVRGEKVTGVVGSPKAPPLPAKPDDYGLTPQEQYDRAFGLLRQANYEDAEKAFKGFIEKNSKDKLLDNAKYWYAETFYVRAKFNDAAVAFADAFQQNPKGTKAPDSLLKLAMSLASLEKTQDACSTLDALKGKFPAAPATIRVRADQERARLKCGAGR